MSASTQKSCLRFDALKFRDQLVLWAARHWIAASPECPTMPGMVEEAFSVAGTPDAAEFLHETLTIISTCARRTILFSPVGDPMVAAEEARFLTVVTLARQDGCEELATALLRRWVPAGAALRAFAGARNLSLCVFLKTGSRTHACARSRPFCARSHPDWPDRGVSLIH